MIFHRGKNIYKWFPLKVCNSKKDSPTTTEPNDVIPDIQISENQSSYWFTQSIKWNFTLEMPIWMWILFISMLLYVWIENVIYIISKL